MNTICAESMRVMQPLFQGDKAGSTPSSALQLWFERIAFETAQALNGQWHSRLPRFGTGFIKLQPFPCFGAVHDGRLFAVAIWSNPCARNLPQQTWLELRRFAIAPDAPRFTASRMLGWMARYFRKGRADIERLISYQDLDAHKGTIYKAAGWTPTVVNSDGNWTRKSRPRPKAQSESPKLRWDLKL